MFVKRFFLTRQGLRCYLCQHRGKSTVGHQKTTTVLGQSYEVDPWTNVSPAILEMIGMNLHSQKHHPICLIRQRIQDFFYKRFTKRGNPIFSVFDNESPVVTLKQNFDNLLVPEKHPSRNQADSYYLNSGYMLRAHCTAHQRDFIRAGLNSFLVVGDVYRRDAVDSSHYPVFHQLDGVRLFDKRDLFEERVSKPDALQLFDDTKHSANNQAGHAIEATLAVQHDLKTTLEDMATTLFGKRYRDTVGGCLLPVHMFVCLTDIETQWVDAYFPFTHPSWELEIKYQDKWLEVLGCGVIQQQILNESGAGSKVGWAFGMGLERLAMKLYDIPDIRLFWSKDQRLDQFRVDDPHANIQFKPFSIHPPCDIDLAFWIPETFQENDFYDIVRSLGGNMVEKVELIDVSRCTKLKRTSHCYRITYRHPDRAMEKAEADAITKKIATEASAKLNVKLR